LESRSGSESGSESESGSGSEFESEPKLELELEVGSELEAGYESEWLTQELKDKYRKGLVILLYCYIISLLISQYILCNFTPTDLLSFMLAKEKRTSSGSGNFMRNAEANSSKNKRSLTGNSKASKKNSPPDDNLFYSFCVNNFIPTITITYVNKKKGKTYASSSEKSEVRNAEVYGLASSSKNKKNSTGNPKAAGKQRFSIILKDRSDLN
jgi:hypothetical protein